MINHINTPRTRIRHGTLITFVLIAGLVASFLGCAPSSSKEGAIEPKESKLLSTVVEREGRQINSDYLYVFGKSETDVRRNLGDPVEVRQVPNTEKDSKETAGFDRTDIFVYDGLELEFKVLGAESTVVHLQLESVNHAYVDGVTIGADEKLVTSVLGPPNVVPWNRSNSLDYDEANLSLEFLFNNGKVVKIIVSEPL